MFVSNVLVEKFVQDVDSWVTILYLDFVQGNDLAEMILTKEKLIKILAVRIVGRVILKILFEDPTQSTNHRYYKNMYHLSK